MKTVILNKKTVKLYDSIDEMPMVNFQKYNKYLLIDSGIGSDMDDVDAHISKLAKLIKTDTKKAMIELSNMRSNIAMINNSLSPKYMAFAAIIHSIDGVELTDLSDSNLKAVLDSFNKVKHSWIVEAIYGLKKKVNSELEVYFPENFNSVKEKEAYDRLKRRTMYVLQSLVDDIDNSAEIERMDLELFSKYSPNVFTGLKSVEIKYDKQFETVCLYISQKMNTSAKTMTVLQFYNAVDTMKKQAEQEAKIGKPKKR